MAELSGRRFRAAPPTCLITFDEASPLCGLEAIMRTRLGVAELVRFTQALQNADPTETAAFAADVGGYLVAWNLEDTTEAGEVEPVPATPEGWSSRDGLTQVLLFSKWVNVISRELGGEVSSPLPSGSPSGEPSAEPVATMEA